MPRGSAVGQAVSCKASQEITLIAGASRGTGYHATASANERVVDTDKCLWP